MLFVLTGSSAAGKSAVLPRLAANVPNLALHDFDEIGVPEGAGRRWRHQATEEWARRALACQADGRDCLVTGQSPLGEWLAVPSATRLTGIAVCLLDVSEPVRVARLTERPLPSAPDPMALYHLIRWAEWHRAHADDPQSRQEVIVDDAWDQMRWARWRQWTRADPRWDVPLVDTSVESIERTVAKLAHWIADRRRLQRAKTLPLTGQWWDKYEVRRAAR